MARKPNPVPEASHRIVVLHGKDAFLRREHTASLRERLEADKGEVDQISFDGATADLADVLDECRSFGLMGQHKLVVVDQADQLIKDAGRPIIERYASSPSTEATLVLRTERWHKGKLDKLVEQQGVIVKCDGVSDAQALAWVARRMEKRHDASIERPAAAMLVDRIGPDLGRLDAELGKLAAAAGAGNPVTPAHVETFVGLSREQEVWAIQSSFLSTDASAVLADLREMLDVSKHPTVLVGYAALDLARKLHGAARSLEQGVPEGVIAKQLKLWGTSKDRILASARRLGGDRASSLLDAALETDVAQKSGLGTPERALERLSLKFSAAMSPK